MYFDPALKFWLSKIMAELQRGVCKDAHFSIILDDKIIETT